MGVVSLETSGFWDTQRVIEDISKGSRGEIIRVSRVTKGRHSYVDVRNWFLSQETGELLPGKGIAIPVDVADRVLGAAYTAAEPAPPVGSTSPGV